MGSFPAATGRDFRGTEVFFGKRLAGWTCMPGGMHGRLLRVDLSSGTWRIEDLPGEAVALPRRPGVRRPPANNEFAAGADPLGLENLLIFAVGPAAGTRLIGASRSGVFAHSSLTGFFGRATRAAGRRP